jgi:hypothetical protein
LIGAVGGSPTRDLVIARGETGIITIAPTEVGVERRINATLEDAVATINRRPIDRELTQYRVWVPHYLPAQGGDHDISPNAI